MGDPTNLLVLLVCLEGVASIFRVGRHHHRGPLCAGRGLTHALTATAPTDLTVANEDKLLMSQVPLVGPRRETINVPGRTFLAAERRLTRLREAMPTELTFLLLGRPRAQAAVLAKAHAKRKREVISSLHSHLSKERVTLETPSSLATRMLKAQGASRRDRRLLHQQCRKVVVTPYPWLLCNYALPARQLEHDEWTDLSEGIASC